VLARISFGVAAMMVGTLVLAGYVTRHDDERSIYPVATGESGPAGLAAFYRQKLTWTTCGGSICTWVRVPMDYAVPQGETVRLRLRVKPSTSRSDTRHLLVNPGGPGASGVEFVDRFTSVASAGLRSRYDIVGFDPRGVGQSDPLACFTNASFQKLIDLDPDPDDVDEVHSLQLGFERLGKTCVKKSGAIASHVSTEEAARDMDVLRALLGDKRLDYYGASYGTQLGATYADLFPHKTGRMVLDGAVDPTLTKERQAYGQAASFERALRSFLSWCVGTGACPLGGDEDKAETALVKLMSSIDDNPLRAGDRKLSKGSAVYGIAYGLYDRKSWDILATGLSRASFGDGSVLLTLADSYFGRGSDGIYRSGAQTLFAIRCLDFPGTLSNGEIGALLPSYTKASPVFGPVMAWSAAECRNWAAEADHPQRPVRAKGAPPIVVIGTTRDPATPYAWATSLAAQLSSGVLVSRVGDGHTAYGVGNSCIDEVVDRFLEEGTSPDRDTSCDGA
jgi:pimeloyl-ACP methyl ester carboxylesterase